MKAKENRKKVARLPYSRERTEQMVREASKQVPEKFRPYVAAMAPWIALLGDVYSKLEPQIARLWNLALQGYEMLRPYGPEDLLPAIFGLLLCFFGGTFVLTIAAVEAWRTTSWEKTKRDLYALYQDHQAVSRANEKDNQEDKDGDGIADVDQVQATELMWRKVNMVLKSVDPDRVTSALTGIYTGFLAVVAALKIQFARAVALGASIGDVFNKPAQRHLTPIVQSVLPTQYKRWSRTLVTYAVKFITIQAAWMLQRMISTLHSAIRGGTMFSRGILDFLRKKEYIGFTDKDTYVDEVVGAAVSFLGFMFQLRAGWRIPFPLNVLFIPVSLLEVFLSCFVGGK